jgi:hypothetical protein
MPEALIILYNNRGGYIKLLTNAGQLKPRIYLTFTDRGVFIHQIAAYVRLKRTKFAYALYK